jgi:broad specificity phosphatase PhoE
VILLVRHGETDYNRAPIRFQGRTDVPLNDSGRAQMSVLADELAAGEPLAAIYTSNLCRARESAEIVGQKLGLEPIVDERFAEADRGTWEGETFVAVERADPDGYAAFRAAGEQFRFPGGESLREQRDRVLDALADISAEQRDRRSLVVCHGGSIRVALCHATGRGLDAFHDWDVPNGALIPLP